MKKPNAGRGGGSGAGSRNRTQQREGFIKQSVRTTGGGGQSTKTNTGKNQWVEAHTNIREENVPSYGCVCVQ